MTEGRNCSTCLAMSDDCSMLHFLLAKGPTVSIGWATKPFPV